MTELQALIDKFWQDAITNEELVKLEQLLKSQRHNNDLSYLSDADQPTTGFLSTERAIALQQRISTRIDAAAVRNTVNIRRSRRGLVYMAAAAAAAVLLVCTVYLTQDGSNSHPPAAGKAIASKGPQLQTITNESDSIRHIDLADSSVVKLEKGATISFYIPFAKGSRSVSLTGAAEFTVTRQAEFPFTVYTNGIRTQVLGTRFRIAPGKTAPALEIALYEGRVMVTKEKGGSGKRFILSAGQRLRIDSATFDNGVQETLVTRKTSRTDQNIPGSMLQFKNEPLANVFDAIGRQYSVQFRYHDRKALEDIRFTGIADSHEPVEQVIATICKLNDLTYRIKGNVITLSKQ